MEKIISGVKFKVITRVGEEIEFWTNLYEAFDSDVSIADLFPCDLSDEEVLIESNICEFYAGDLRVQTIRKEIILMD